MKRHWRRPQRGRLGTIPEFHLEYPEVQLARERRDRQIEWLTENWAQVLVGGAAGVGFLVWLAWPWLKGK